MVVIAITCWGGPSKWWQVMNSISILFQLHPNPTSMYLLHNDIVCPTALFHAPYTNGGEGGKRNRLYEYMYKHAYLIE